MWSWIAEYKELIAALIALLSALLGLLRWQAIRRARQNSGHLSPNVLGEGNRTMVDTSQTANDGGTNIIGDNNTVMQPARTSPELSEPLIHGTWNWNLCSMHTVKWHTTILNDGGIPVRKLEVSRDIGQGWEVMQSFIALGAGRPQNVRIELPEVGAHSIRISCETSDKRLQHEHVLQYPDQDIQYLLEERSNE